MHVISHNNQRHCLINFISLSRSQTVYTYKHPLPCHYTRISTDDLVCQIYVDVLYCTWLLGHSNDQLRIDLGTPNLVVDDTYSCGVVAG